MEDTKTVQLYRELFQLIKKTHRMFHTHMAGHMLHSGQNYLLMLVSRYDGAMQQDLAEKMDIRPSSMTELLVKLEQAGFIMRKKDDKDQRVMRVFITEEGKQNVKQVGMEAEGWWSDLFSCLTGEEQDLLLELLQKVSACIEEKTESCSRHGHGSGRRHHEHDCRCGRHSFASFEQYDPHGSI